MKLTYPHCCNRIALHKEITTKYAIVTENIQIGLSIGNSRYHWAWYLNTKLQSSWDTEYLTIDRSSHLFPIDLQEIIKASRIDIDNIPIYLISVVPIQTEICAI